MASPSGNRQSGGTVPVVSARHTDGVDGQRVCVCVCATQTETRRVNDIRVMRGRQQQHCPGTASRRRRHHRHRSTTTATSTTSSSSFTHHHSSSLMDDNLVANVLYDPRRVWHKCLPDNADHQPTYNLQTRPTA